MSLTIDTWLSCLDAAKRDMTIAVKKYHFIVRARDELIADALNSGISAERIRSMMNISHYTIMKICKYRGIELKRHNSSKNTHIMSRNSEIVSLYRGGKSLREIGKLFGLTAARIHQIIKDHEQEIQMGITRARGGYRGSPKSVS